MAIVFPAHLINTTIIPAMRMDQPMGRTLTLTFGYKIKRPASAFLTVYQAQTSTT